ncbi:MAG TPA: hypothetical protein PLA03_01265 [Acidobacteriota bacterium]|nr:hypothetical protein [Acidobacteriota bacterium]HNT18061.1 hypothetical protein [Acidobacteriota bacterium]HQO18969.1 hypothetical protein [Acidobacteriota bacterium]
MKRPFMDVAQPRWVGPKYWGSPCRVVVLMLNPGQGKKKELPVESKKRLHNFRDGTASLDDIFMRQKEGMKQWGWPKGRFLDYYCGKLGLDLDEIAFANVAWCATEGNNYPRKMLDRCFNKHTARLFEILEPRAVLACGTKTRRYAAGLTDITVIKLLHHAHRKGNEAEEKEIERVKEELKAQKVWVQSLHYASFPSLFLLFLSLLESFLPT